MTIIELFLVIFCLNEKSDFKKVFQNSLTQTEWWFFGNVKF
jgi:hypothetical protein